MHRWLILGLFINYCGDNSFVSKTLNWRILRVQSFFFSSYALLKNNNNKINIFKIIYTYY